MKNGPIKNGVETNLLKYSREFDQQLAQLFVHCVWSDVVSQAGKNSFVLLKNEHLLVQFFSKAHICSVSYPKSKQIFFKELRQCVPITKGNILKNLSMRLVILSNHSMWIVILSNLSMRIVILSNLNMRIVIISKKKI